MNDNRLNVRAQRIGENFFADPELTLPQRPYFPPEIQIIPYANKGLLFEGVKGRQVILGRSSTTFIPALLAKLDGNHTLDQLCEQFPQVPRKALHDSLALLYSRGLLEDGIAPELPAGQLRELAAFAGRYNDVTRSNRNRGDALARLASARVAIAAGAGQEYLWQALDQQNLGQLKIVSGPEQLDADTDLLLAVFVGNDRSASTWLAQAHRLNLRTLHAHVGTDYAEIGPLFVPGKSGCYDCLRQIHPAPSGDAPPDLGFWCGVLALNALHLLSRIGSMGLYNTTRVHRHTANGKIFDEIKIARLPGCPTCGLAGCRPQLHEPDGQVWLLHNNCDAMPYHELRNPRDHQRHYAATNVEITSQPPKPFYGAPLIALPAEHAINVPPAWEALPPQKNSLDLHDLGRVLRVAAGYQPMPDHSLRRLAPNGGGMGACNLFLIVRRVAGLENGVYHYFGFQHALELIGAVSDELLQGILGVRLGQLPSVVVVGTALMVKLRRKYDNFSFRLGNLDSGAAKGCLYEALDALGIAHVEYVGSRDKAMADALHLPVAGHRSMITFTVGIGQLNTMDHQPDLTMYHYHYPDSLIEMTGTPGRAWALPPPRQLGHSGRGTGHTGLTLEQIMLARRSLREYAVRAVPLPVLKSMLALASDFDLASEQTGALALRMKIWVIVTIDGDLARGAYYWDPASEQLVLRRADVSREMLEGAMSQKSFSHAPIVLFISADFEQAITSHGARGYRDLFSRAGSMMNRMLLVAQVHGLGGCMWGGITEEMLGEILDIDRYRDCPLFGGSIGYANHG